MRRPTHDAAARTARSSTRVNLRRAGTASWEPQGKWARCHCASLTLWYRSNNSPLSFLRDDLATNDALLHTSSQFFRVYMNKRKRRNTDGKSASAIQCNVTLKLAHSRLTKPWHYCAQSQIPALHSRVTMFQKRINKRVAFVDVHGDARVGFRCWLSSS